MPLREFAGAAVVAQLASTLAIGGTSVTIDNASGWPTGASAPFVVVVDPDTAKEEKMLIQSRSGTTLVVAGGGRAYDGTTAFAHNPGASIAPCLDAITVTEVNSHVNNTALDNHTQYLNNARHDLAARHTFGGVFPTPTAPPAISTVGQAGVATGPARSDHTHALGAGMVDTAALANDGVTYAKIQNVSVTDRLLGRDTAGAGDVEELTVANGLTFTGSGGIGIAPLGVTDAMVATANKDGSAGTASLRTLGTGAAQAMAGNDTRVTNAVQKDGSVVMTGLLTLSGSPSSALHASTKAYAERFKTRYVQEFPGAGNWTSGQTLETLSIPDPGYDITVWVAGSLLANAQTLSYWEIQCYVDGTKTGGIVIPHAQLGVNQTYAVLGRPTTHTTGTPCTVVLKINRTSGSGNFDTASNTAANNLLTAYYTAL